MRLRPGGALTGEERETLLWVCEMLEGECVRVEEWMERNNLQDAVPAEVSFKVNRTITGKRGLIQPAVYEGQKPLRGETVFWGAKDKAPSVVIAKVSDIREWVEACRSGMVSKVADFDGEESEPDE